MRPPILAISDPQFHAYKAHSTYKRGMNSRLAEIIDAWDAAINIGLKEGCGLLLMPGDVFEIRGSIKPSVFNRVAARIQDVLDIGMGIVIVPGNHDMEDYQGGDSAVDSWAHLIGVQPKGYGIGCQVIRKPDVVSVKGYSIAGIPYMTDMAKFKDVFRDISNQDPDITLIHQGVDDFDPTGTLTTGLTAKWLSDNNKGVVLCGHYHNSMRAGRIVNVGALVQHRLSDEGQERGCWTISNIQDPASITFHPIAGPHFLTITSKAGVNGNCKDAFVVVKAKTIKEAEKLKKLAMDAGAKSAEARIEKVFATAHEQTVTLSTPRNMLGEYLDIVPKFTARKVEILELFDKVCLNGSSA